MFYMNDVNAVEIFWGWWGGRRSIRMAFAMSKKLFIISVELWLKKETTRRGHVYQSVQQYAMDESHSGGAYGSVCLMNSGKILNSPVCKHNIPHYTSHPSLLTFYIRNSHIRQIISKKKQTLTFQNNNNTIVLQNTPPLALGGSKSSP